MKKLLRVIHFLLLMAALSGSALAKDIKVRFYSSPAFAELFINGVSHGFMPDGSTSANKAFPNTLVVRKDKKDTMCTSLAVAAVWVSVVAANQELMVCPSDKAKEFAFFRPDEPRGLDADLSFQAQGMQVAAETVRAMHLDSLGRTNAISSALGAFGQALQQSAGAATRPRFCQWQ